MAYYFFTEPEKLTVQQASTVAFGPVSENVYRVCNLFSATASAKAFAVADGCVLVQEIMGVPHLVNIVLKPSFQPNLDLPKIDFIIYKGILKSSIIEPNNVIANSSKNDLTRKIWESHSLQTAAFANNPNVTPSIAPLAEECIGFAYSSTGTGINSAADGDSLNKAFFNSNHALFNVTGGDYIGDFDSSAFGIMIVFEKVGFKATFKFARELDSKFEFPELSSTATDADKFKRRHDKEAVLAFIDSCAFFSAFALTGINVFTGTGFSVKKDTELNLVVTQKHYNKEKVYLDIRNEYDDSFNYYRNYNDSISLDLENDGTLSTTNYYRSGWPLFIIDKSELSTNTTKVIKLALPNHDNESPLIYLKRAFRADIGKDRIPSNREKFLTPVAVTSTSLSRSVKLNQDIIFRSADGELVSDYYLLKYIKRVRVDDDQATGPSSGVDTNEPPSGHALFKRTYLDNIFPIFDLEIPFTNPDYTTLKVYYDVTHIDKILVKDIPQREILGNYTLRDFTSSVGVATDESSITFISFPFLYNTNPNRNNSILPLASMELAGTSPFLIELSKLISTISLSRSSFQLSNNSTVEYVKVETNTESSDVSFNPTNYNFNDVTIISVTKAQYEVLKTLKDQEFPGGYKVYLGIKDVAPIISNGNTYFSFKLVLRGLRQSNSIVEAHAVDAGITLYTDEQILGISSGHVFPVAKAYIEEDFGERSNGQHKGIDMETTTDTGTAGLPIYAARGGTVDKIVKLNNLKHHGGDDVNLGGIRVRIKGDNGFYYNYFHMQPNSNDSLHYGDTVTKGAQIGTIGISGFGYGVNPNWTQYHLHFEVWQSVSPLVKISPYKVFPELALLPFDNHRGD